MQVQVPNTIAMAQEEVCDYDYLTSISSDQYGMLHVPIITNDKSIETKKINMDNEDIC